MHPQTTLWRTHYKPNYSRVKTKTKAIKFRKRLKIQKTADEKNRTCIYIDTEKIIQGGCNQLAEQHNSRLESHFQKLWSQLTICVSELVGPQFEQMGASNLRLYLP